MTAMSAAAHSTTAMANEFSLGIIILSVCYTDLVSNYITYNYMKMCRYHVVYSLLYTSLLPSVTGH